MTMMTMNNCTWCRCSHDLWVMKQALPWLKGDTNGYFSAKWPSNKFVHGTNPLKANTMMSKVRKVRIEKILANPATASPAHPSGGVWRCYHPAACWDSVDSSWVATRDRESHSFLNGTTGWAQRGGKHRGLLQKKCRLVCQKSVVVVVVFLVAYCNMNTALLRFPEDAVVRTFQGSEILPHNIRKCCTISWHLISLQTHGSVTPTGPPGSGLCPHQRRLGQVFSTVFTLNTQ